MNNSITSTIESIKSQFDVKNEFNLDDMITLYLPNSIQITFDLDIAWCRIHHNLKLVGALEFNDNLLVMIVTIVKGLIK